VRLTIHIHLESMLRVTGTALPLCVHGWNGDNFTVGILEPIASDDGMIGEG